MPRIYGDYAYGPGPRAGCWWDETVDMPQFSALAGTQTRDVAIIGAGYTGVSAALELAEAGVTAAVVDAQTVGWGASGRNGGFCCLGGARASDERLNRTFGVEGRRAYRAAERSAVELVERRIKLYQIDADQCPRGEVELAHRAKDIRNAEAAMVAFEENYGAKATFIPKDNLDAHGLSGPWFGGIKHPLGFGLNPRKYLAGLVAKATEQGAALFENSPALSIDRTGSQWEVRTPNGCLQADQVIVATNGYSSENLPPWLAGRYMPTQSTVLVTRPLTPSERTAAGWHSDLMAYDSRNLLHYFRMLPDGRFLFGMRGGLLTGQGADRRSKQRLLRDFHRLFPAWRTVEVSHVWSGMVCIAMNTLPYVGAVPRMPGVWVGMCYHGNGVAMGSLCGSILSDLVRGSDPACYPEAMQQGLSRFPLGRARRLVMPAVYAGFMLADL